MNYLGAPRQRGPFLHIIEKIRNFALYLPYWAISKKSVVDEAYPQFLYNSSY